MRNVPANAQALLDLDKDGALVPHGIGGHARTIITEFISEHGRLTARIAELEQRLKPFAVTADTWTVQNAAHRGILLTLSNGERMCAMDASDFIAARTTLEASERGGGV